MAKCRHYMSYSHTACVWKNRIPGCPKTEIMSPIRRPESCTWFVVRFQNRSQPCTLTRADRSKAATSGRNLYPHSMQPRGAPTIKTAATSISGCTESKTCITHHTRAPCGIRFTWPRHTHSSFMVWNFPRRGTTHRPGYPGASQTESLGGRSVKLFID